MKETTEVTRRRNASHTHAIILRFGFCHFAIACTSPTLDFRLCVSFLFFLHFFSLLYSFRFGFLAHAYITYARVFASSLKLTFSVNSVFFFFVSFFWNRPAFAEKTTKFYSILLSTFRGFYTRNFDFFANFSLAISCDLNSCSTSNVQRPEAWIVSFVQFIQIKISVCCVRIGYAGKSNPMGSN